MSAWLIILTILQLLTALAVVVIVLFQSGKSAGLSGAIGGVADTFLAKNKAKIVLAARSEDKLDRLCKELSVYS